tara:strand:+ start:6903 stop:7040 length:138 start_codon:yes stop_codon:yes gene_type:complete
MLGLPNILTNLVEETSQQLFVSFLTEEDGTPIAEEDGDNLIRENL